MSSPKTLDKTALVGKKLLNGTIELVRCIGSGASGRVYYAVDATNSEKLRYAVKVVDMPQYLRHHDHLMNEITMLQRMHDDENVSTLRHVTEDDDFVYLVMDLAPGRTVNAFVKHWEQDKYESTCFESKKKVMLQIMETIQRCNDRSIYHRDIKCENIMVHPHRDLLTIIDFGISTENEVSFDRRLGTPQYMSPECYHDFDSRQLCVPYETAVSDVWSLGVLLAIMMVGKLIWRRPTLSDPVFAEFIRYPDSFFRSNYGVTKEAQALLSRALEYDPSKRIDLPTFITELRKLDKFFVSTIQMLWTPMAPLVESMTNLKRITRALDTYEQFWDSRAEEARAAGISKPPVYGRQRKSISIDSGVYADHFMALCNAETDDETDSEDDLDATSLTLARDTDGASSGPVTRTSSLTTTVVPTGSSQQQLAAYGNKSAELKLALPLVKATQATSDKPSLPAMKASASLAELLGDLDRFSLFANQDAEKEAQDSFAPSSKAGAKLLNGLMRVTDSTVSLADRANGRS